MWMLSHVQNRTKPKAKSRSRWQLAKELARHVAIGLATTAVLLGLKIYLESKPLGHRFELAAYEVLHGQIPALSSDLELPVVVLDISQVPGGYETVTSRDTLRDMIQGLLDLKEKPRAIAIDIDFSPGNSGWMDPKDPDFFSYCLEQSRKSRVPILLGVSRTAAKKPNAWLGGEEFKTLAADITVDATDTSRLRYWIQKGDNERLLSMSAALVKLVDPVLPEPPKWIGFALLDQSEVIAVSQSERIQSGFFRVNYSKLNAIRLESVSATSKQSITDLAEKFRNRIVILGDGQIGRATDTFRVPIQFPPVPGVFLHASGVYSLAVEPFYEFTHTFRILIDFLLAFSILVGVAALRWRRRNRSFNWERMQRRFIWAVVAVSILGGILAVALLDVLWLDFLLVIFLLLLHPTVERVLERAFPSRSNAKKVRT